jgi:hypothetical protein
MTDTTLYTQLAYYEYLFHAEHHLRRLTEADTPQGTRTPAHMGQHG